MPTPQRISLIEAYDNRDVIAWLVRHSEEIKDLKAAIDALPESDQFVMTIGDQTIAGTKSFVNKIVAAGGIEADTLVKINADLQVYGDIYQNGSAYDTHAEQLYTTKDYILMRDGAVTALSPGTMSGFEILKYDGTNNLRLAADNNGVARVGDVGDEQPLMTRDETIPNGALLKWYSTNLKAVPVSNSDGIARVFTGSVSFAASVWASDVTAPPDFPYSHEIQVSTDIEGDSTEYPVVSLSPYNTENALLAPFCDTYPAQGATPGGVKVYASAIPTTQIALDYAVIKKVTV